MINYGRIVIPIDIRKKMKIEEKDPLELYVDGDRIILKKYKESCFFCDSSKDISKFENKNICNKCIREIGNIINN